VGILGLHVQARCLKSVQPASHMIGTNLDKEREEEVTENCVI